MSQHNPQHTPETSDYTWHVHAQQRATRQRIARIVLVLLALIVAAILLGGVLAASAQAAQAQSIAYPPQAFLPFVSAWRPTIVSTCLYPDPCNELDSGLRMIKVQP